MKAAFLFWLGILLFAIPATAGDDATAYAQSYVILIKGNVAGSENVTETINNTGDILSTSEHEIFVTDGLETKRMTFSTKMVLSKGTYTPISYTYKYTSGGTGDSYDVTIKDSQITRILNRGGRIDEVTAPFQQDMVILDFSVYHQYDYLIRKYDVKKGGRQQFADFVPVIGNDIPIAVTYLGNANAEKGIQGASNYRIDFIGLRSGTFSIDANGRLIRLQMPAQDLEVVRKDLLK